MSDSSVSSDRLDVARVRAQFPILADPGLVYLDNGATTQKPQAVVDALDDYYRHHNANIHRAVHRLSQAATDRFESARVKVARFINAPSPDEIIFTRGTTEGINLVASSFGRLAFEATDEILISTLEHHSNIVPWQNVAKERGLTLKVIPIDDRGELLYDAIPSLLSPRTKLVSVTHTSNALGTVIDVKRIIALAKNVGAKVLVDGAQWVGHWPVDVKDIGCDFYVFSGHKLFAPTGIGVLWGRRELLEAMPPYQGGGDMIREVSFAKGTTFADLPNKFEAGTADIAGAIGLGAAVDWLNGIDRAAAAQHEHDLLTYATEKLSAVSGLRVIGTAPNKASIVSFVLDGIDHHTLGTLLDVEGVAVRTGHHCCMPLMDRLGVAGTVRASFSLYNAREDVDRLVTAVMKVQASLKPAAKPQTTLSDDVQYAAATAPTPADAAQTLLDDFGLFEGWAEKYAYLIELGEKLPRLPEREKNEATRIHGCQATVHLTARRKPGTADVLEFAAEANADIVQGLIAIVQMLFSGQQVDRILAFDIEYFFGQLGLSSNLALTRRNGLQAMVARIRQLAKLISESNAKAGVS
ncbi:MAG: SufS family cysteine desulfurase [Tepidisphaeraceae bacterium]